MELNWGLLATAFSGAAAGSIITLIGNYLINRDNYKKDYYKKVIDKRINACEKLGNFLVAFKKIQRRSSEEHYVYVYYECIESVDKITTLLENGKKISENLTWVTLNLNDRYTDLLNGILETHEKLTDNQEKLKVLDSQSKSINELVQKIYDALYTELKELDDVSSFIDGIRKFYKELPNNKSTP